MSHLVVIRGAGELASAIAVRLFNVKVRVVCLEIATPLCVRTTISFASLLYSGDAKHIIEGVPAKLARSLSDVHPVVSSGNVALLVQPIITSQLMETLKPIAIVDAMMTKKGNNGLNMDLAPLTIGLGPGFVAGTDCHYVIETCRGHDLGRIIEKGSALPNTGVPGEIGSRTFERLLKAPVSGEVLPLKKIGDHCVIGEIVATVGEQDVHSSCDGTIRGMISDKTFVEAGVKIGDVDPRPNAHSFCFTITDKSRTISGSVLELLVKQLLVFN
ncbi:hypothetical protein P9112_012514 [Eukaryota sp. TZLM1-RC]